MKDNTFQWDKRYYKAPDKVLWQGRNTPKENGVQYWYQGIERIDLTSAQDSTFDIALLGYACDEGVRRNMGRVGAADGPNAFRQQLAKLAYHHPTKIIADTGTILCPNTHLEASQIALSKNVANFARKGIFPFLIGGGHEIAYAHFMGLWEGVAPKKETRIGMINFDAHFDLRPVVDAPHSGTSFYQILTEVGEQASYFPIGIQQAANTPELFSMAERFGVNYVLSDACGMSHFSLVAQQLHHFIIHHDHLYISIDMDAFSSAYAPGVSAPSPMGLSPEFVWKCLAILFQSQKVIGLDIAELNPHFDRDAATAQLAARICDNVIGLL